MALAFEQAVIRELAFDLPAPVGVHRALFPSAAEVGLLIRGATGQTADLFQMQNSAGALKASLSPAGAARFDGGLSVGGGAQGNTALLADGNILHLLPWASRLLGQGGPDPFDTLGIGLGSWSFVNVRMNGAIAVNNPGDPNYIVSIADSALTGVRNGIRVNLSGTQTPLFVNNAFARFVVGEVGADALLHGTGVQSAVVGDAYGFLLNPALKAGVDGDVLTGLRVAVIFDDNGKSGVVHRGLEVASGDVLLAGATDAIGFYGVPPVTRQLLATGASHTVDDVIAALQTLGLVRQS